jgi:tRNA wybutosine-synthesizing protein 2
VKEKCVIHLGDNRETCPVGIADRVIMGLIPTSIPYLPVACRALKSQGILHVHENVSSFGIKGKLEKKEFWNNWGHELVLKTKLIMKEMKEDEDSNVELIQVVQVKRYAPHIDHLVADIRIF